MITFADVLRAEDYSEALERQAKWDWRWMSVAAQVATFSKDPGHKIGAVIVDVARNSLISTGYNGFTRRTPDRNLHDRPHKLRRTVHAEINAILNLPIPAHSKELTLYVAGLPPCEHCAPIIVQSGILRVVSLILSEKATTNEWAEQADAANELFRDSGVIHSALRPPCK